MLKGKSTIELTDIHTGRKEIFQDENLVTEAIYDILNSNIQGTLFNSTSYNGAGGDNWMMPIYTNLTGGILLFQNPIEEKTSNIYAPRDNPLIGYASAEVNTSTDVKLGSRNLTESKAIENGYKYVWEFNTSQANGTISCICLTSITAGRGLASASNYLVKVKENWAAQNQVSSINYRNNCRIFIEDGYRLEMITPYNSKTATLRKVWEDYLHARLMIRPYSKVWTTSAEETSIDLGHYPYWATYSGGSLDGTDGTLSTSGDTCEYLVHASDGKWYGLARHEFQKYDHYDYYYEPHERYAMTSYEWYLDTISDGKCTSQKVELPSNSVATIGMSGKWLMLGIGTKVYRLDTENVANLEEVENFTYNSDHQVTFRIDDDVVISGWYFIDGKPGFYVRQKSSKGGVRWGQSMMTKYKTYLYQEYYTNPDSYNYNYLLKDLYLYAPYLATINNLSDSVIKTADKTMKITYTLTEVQEES